MSLYGTLLKGLVFTFLTFLLAVVLYLAFWFVLRPFKKRRFFLKFPKIVGLSPSFIPFLGDFKHLNEEYIHKGKFIGHFLRDLASTLGSKIAFFASLGMEDMLFVNDVEYLNELQKFTPTVLDREPIDTTGFGRVGGTGGLAQSKTTTFWKKRRQTFTKTIGINHASRFIPIFLNHCQKEIRTFKEGETINMSEYANTISFEIICEILYGCDIRDKLDLVNYTDTNGEICKMNLYECLMKISHDCSFASMKPMNVLFPWLVHFSIGSENRRNTKNSDEFERVIRDLCAKSEDPKSVYNQVLNMGEIDPETIYKDVMAILFGGHETTSKSLCSSLLHLKKNPEVEKKLRKELDEVLLENGKYTIDDLNDILCNDTLDKLDYLTCFVKEILRHDPPAVRSLGYKANATFKVKDLRIPKNQIVVFNLFAAQYDERQWIEPMKFIPERFDSSSDYFLTPEGKNRNPLSFCPFTFGARTCPGRALGLMEMKILVIYFMLGIDFEIDQETLENEDISYAIMSPFSLNIKVNKVNA
mmetsp:Transcript_17327/g.19397  ORF Transcript_17327/g.19397 Transcript_17327/m.19397 type:complete len:529 (+) Transcript_17327:28-1614(+)